MTTSWQHIRESVTVLERRLRNAADEPAIPGMKRKMAFGQKPHVEQPFQAAWQARKPAPRVTYAVVRRMGHG